MSLSIVKRPEGYVLDTTPVTATVSNSAGDALFNSPSHGMNSSDVLYIYSNLSSYNGYWSIDKIDADNFKIKEYIDASYQPFINSGSVTYYKSLSTHKFNCVHLPIVYLLKSTVWPTNGVDSARNINTFTNYLGYTYLVASGDIKATGTTASLEKVVLSGTSVDGVYKILYWFSDTNFVIDLPYSAGNVLSSGTVQYYYFNYSARVRIYAGLDSSNKWAAQKPYELIGEVRLIPDANGIVSVNISNYLKSKIEIISNNPIKDTLPNNIDAFCNYYITYAESYDDSNMYSVSEYVSSYTDDSANFGYAINSQLPFKTRSQGALSDYTWSGVAGSYFKFLTPFSRPTIFPGYYFDLAFLMNAAITSYGGYKLIQQSYTEQGSLITTQTTSVSVDSTNNGVFRQQVSELGPEAYQIVYLAIDEPFTAPSGWSNGPGGNAFGSKTATQLIKNTMIATIYAAEQSVNIESGATPNLVTLNIAITGLSSGVITVSVKFYDSTNSNVVATSSTPFLTNVSGDYTFNFSALSGRASWVSIQASYSGVASPNITITVPVGSLIATQRISEQKYIDVDQNCANQNFYLTWLNNLGGYDYWNFKARKRYTIEVTKNSTQDTNIFNNWPKAWGEFADSLKTQTERKGQQDLIVNSQFLTLDQEDSIKLLFASPLVQLCSSKYDRTTIIIDPASVPIRRDQDKTRKLTFNCTYTNELPGQSK